MKLRNKKTGEITDLAKRGLLKQTTTIAYVEDINVTNMPLIKDKK